MSCFSHNAIYLLLLLMLFEFSLVKILIRFVWWHGFAKSLAKKLLQTNMAKWVSTTPFIFIFLFFRFWFSWRNKWDFLFNALFLEFIELWTQSYLSMKYVHRTKWTKKCGKNKWKTVFSHEWIDWIWWYRNETDFIELKQIHIIFKLNNKQKKFDAHYQMQQWMGSMIKIINFIHKILMRENLVLLTQWKIQLFPNEWNFLKYFAWINEANIYFFFEEASKRSWDRNIE